jgi:tRNA threonylcarbamoyladenosine biosynthesis protein TsaB
MKVLAIDTSSRCGSVGLCEDGVLLREVSVLSREAYSATLLPCVHQLLESLNLPMDEIDVFGVTLGPGSFTGLRVGVATVKGFAWSMKKPVVGLQSLEVLAHNIRREGVVLVPMLDARKGRVYGAVYRWSNGRLQTVIEAQDIEASRLVVGHQAPIVAFGDGARKYQAQLEAQQNIPIEFPEAEADIPRGSVLSRLAFEAFQAGKIIDIYTVEPLYLRPSEAELLEQARLGGTA